MSEIRIVSGTGRYADPYHDFPATSARIADVARQSGHHVEIADDVEAGLRELAGIDLVIVNVGTSGDDHPGAEVIADLEKHVSADGSLLAMHASSIAFPGLDEWERLIGGRWVPGTTMHPKIDTAHVHVLTDTHPIVDGLADFDVYDERYSYQRVADDITPLADHRYDDLVHPLAWIRGKVGYDALGHGIESYESGERCDLLRREIAYLLS